MFRSMVAAYSAQLRFVQQFRQPTVAAVGSRICCADNVSRTMSMSSKTPEATVIVEDGFVKKFFKTVGWLDQTRTRLKLSGYFLYECVSDRVLYTEWFKECELPDTFASWFAVTELHVWMLMVRSMAQDVNVGRGDPYVKEGEGRFVRNCIVEALWADVGNRIKVLEGANQSIARKQVAEMSEQFQAALVGYDEGLHDDRVLAAALWRRLFSMELVEAEHVEKVVKFVRKQMMELDKISWDTIRKQPDIMWLSITECRFN